jgi:hypothetical protein
VNFILDICIPQPNGDNAGVVSEHDFDAALCSFVTFARLDYVVEVDHSALEHKIAWPRHELD